MRCWQPREGGWGSQGQGNRKPQRQANNSQFLCSEIARVHLRELVAVYLGLYRPAGLWAGLGELFPF